MSRFTRMQHRADIRQLAAKYIRFVRNKQPSMAPSLTIGSATNLVYINEGHAVAMHVSDCLEPLWFHFKALREPVHYQ